MKTRKILLIVAGMLFMSIAAIAQPQSGPKYNRPGFGKMQMMRMLNLTKEQQSKLSDMRLSMEKEMLPLRNQMITLRGNLKLELIANNFNQGKVNKIVDQISDVRKEMSLKMIQHMREVRSILTPEQQKKFDLMVMHPKKGGFGHRPPMRRDGAWGRGAMRGQQPMHPWMNPPNK